MNNLELFASELLFILFEYLDDVQLIRAFYGLNSRFNCLLSSHFRAYHFDFRSISKKDFDFICQQYLPPIVDRIISLRFSDNDDTPQQSDLFLSTILSSNQFIQLRSLSLLNLRYEYLINKIINQLPNLTHLTVSICGFHDDLNNVNQIINNIWSLPKLSYCKLENVICFETLLTVPTVISSSLQRLIINNNSCNLNEFARLSEYTPALEYISVSIWDVYSTDQLSTVLLSLNTLKLNFEGSSHVLINLLKMMPNLCCLMIKRERIIFNGYQWEEIIESHLPNLKVFRFIMQFSFPDNDNREEEIDEILRSFQTQFWVCKHQLFVRCHWEPYNENKLISLYTLPYYFDYFVHKSNMKFKSTYPDDKQDHSYDRVHSLLYNSNLSKEISLASPITFSNLRNLRIEFPVNDHFWSIVPTVKQLTSLDIERFNNTKACVQLQTLLDRASNLYSLTFKSSHFCPKFLFELKSTSIRRLDLQGCGHWFNKQQCTSLINSPFIKQCEVLSIRVKKRANILQLVKKMNKLRALIFQCDDDKWEIEENHIIEWLHHHLPSTCLITRDTDRIDIRISIQ